MDLKTIGSLNGIFPIADQEEEVHYILHDGRSEKILGGPKKVYEVKCPRCGGKMGIACHNDVPKRSSERAWFCMEDTCLAKNCLAFRMRNPLPDPHETPTQRTTRQSKTEKEPQKSYSTPWDDDL